MHKLIERYCRFLDVLMATALAAMVVLVFGNVVLRYVFNSGISVSEELSRWLMVWMTFIGAVVALKEHAHLGTDVIVSRLPAPARRACLVIGQLLMLYATWLLLTGSLEQTRINFDVHAPVTGLPVGIVYAAGVFFGASALLLLMLELWRTVTGRLRDDELIMVRDSEEIDQIEELHFDQIEELHSDQSRTNAKKS